MQMLYDIFQGKIYEDIQEIEACGTKCPSVSCVRNSIHRKQMWFGEWIDGEPQKKKDCKNYLEKFSENIKSEIRSDI